MKSLFFAILFALLLPACLVHSQQRVFVAGSHNITTLCRVELSSCTIHDIGALPIGIFTIALTPNGKLWAIQSNDFGHLYSVDTATGQVTYVDSFDTHGTYVQSLGVLNDSVLLIQCDSVLYGVTTTNVHSFRIGTVGNYHSGDMTWLGQDLYIIGYSDANPLNSRLVKVTFNNGSYPPIASAAPVSTTPSLPYCYGLATYILPNMDTALIGFADSSAYVINPADGSYILYCDILPDSLYASDAASTSYPSVPIVLDTVNPNPNNIVRPLGNGIQVKLYPNPAGKTLNVHYENNAKAILILTDITGRVIFQQQIKKGTQQINTEPLAAGPYIVTIQAEDGAVYRQKILKE